TVDGSNAALATITSSCLESRPLNFSISLGVISRNLSPSEYRFKASIFILSGFLECCFQTSEVTGESCAVENEALGVKSLRRRPHRSQSSRSSLSTHTSASVVLREQLRTFPHVMRHRLKNEIL